MDFVVLGFGIGALAVLLGLTARDLGPFARRIPRDGALPWAEVAQRAAWGRACRAGGLVLALAGGLLCLVTGITLLVQASDSAGMRAVVIGVVLAVLAIAAWASLYIWRPPFIAAPHLPARTPKRPSGRGSANRPARARDRQDSRRRPSDDREESNSGRRQRPDDRRSSDPRQRRRDAERQSRTPSSAPSDGPRLGALTVDAMGGLRRAPISSPDYDGYEDTTEPAPSPERPAPRRTRTEPSNPSPRSGRDRRSG